MLAWQQKILANERLASLGTVAAGVMHDAKQPISYMSMNAQRLDQLYGCLSELQAAYSHVAPHLSTKARRQLHELIDELPTITRDIHVGCELLNGLTAHVGSFVRADDLTTLCGTRMVESLRATPRIQDA